MDCRATVRRLIALLLLLILIFLPPVGFVLTVTSSNAPVWLKCAYFSLLVLALVAIMKWAFLNQLQDVPIVPTTESEGTCATPVVDTVKFQSVELPPAYSAGAFCQIYSIEGNSSSSQTMSESDPPTYEEAISAQQNQQINKDNIACTEL